MEGIAIKPLTKPPPPQPPPAPPYVNTEQQCNNNGENSCCADDGDESNKDGLLSIDKFNVTLLQEESLLLEVSLKTMNLRLQEMDVLATKKRAQLEENMSKAKRLRHEQENYKVAIDRKEKFLKRLKIGLANCLGQLSRREQSGVVLMDVEEGAESVTSSELLELKNIVLEGDTEVSSIATLKDKDDLNYDNIIIQDDTKDKQEENNIISGDSASENRYADADVDEQEDENDFTVVAPTIRVDCLSVEIQPVICNPLFRNLFVENTVSPHDSSCGAALNIIPQTPFGACNSAMITRTMELIALELLTLEMNDATSLPSNHRRQSIWNTCLDYLIVSPSAAHDCESNSNDNNTTHKHNDTGTSMDVISNTNNIHPYIAMCPYEISGKCADDYCPFQHYTTPKPKSIITGTETKEHNPGAPWWLPREILLLPPLSLGKLPAKNSRNENSSSKTKPAAKSNAVIDLTHDQQVPNDESSSGSDIELSMDADYIALPTLTESPTHSFDDDNKEDDSDNFENKNENEVLSVEKVRNDRLLSHDHQKEDIICCTLPKPSRGEVSVIDGSDDTNDDDECPTNLVNWMRKYCNVHVQDDKIYIQQRSFTVPGLINAFRLAIHSGRYDLAHSICDLLKLSLSDLYGDNLELHSISTFLSNILLSAWRCNSVDQSMFATCFDTQVTLLLLLIVSQVFPNSNQVDIIFSSDDIQFFKWGMSLVKETQHVHKHVDTQTFSAVDVATIAGKLRQSLQFVGQTPENAKQGHAGGKISKMYDDMRAVSVIHWNVKQGQDLRALLSNNASIPVRSCIEDVLESCWTILKQHLNVSNGIVDIIKCITLMGYIMIGVAENVSKSLTTDVVRAKEYATLSDFDTVFARITKECFSLVSNRYEQLDLILCPLFAISVSISTYLRNYTKSCNRLEWVLCRSRRQMNYPEVSMFSDLLWSQFVHVRVSLPTRTENATNGELSDDVKNDHKTIASYIEKLGIHLTYICLPGDWNLSRSFREPRSEAEKNKSEDSLLQLWHLMSLHHQDAETTTASKMDCSLNIHECQFMQGHLKGRLYSPLRSSLPHSILLCGRFCKQLTLAKCNLHVLPQTFGRYFPLLETISLVGNHLCTLPSSFGNMSCLTIILLTNNKLRSLPETIGNLSRLQSLLVDQNLLTSIPIELSQCKKLEILNLSKNRLENFLIGEWLVKLPLLHTLDFSNKKRYES